MMELVKIATGEPITREQIEAEQADQGKQIRLKQDLTGFDLSGFGVSVIEPFGPPEVGAEEVAERNGAEEYEPGKWRMAWTVRARTAEELEQAKADKQASISVKRDEVMAAGFVPSTGPVAGHRLQTRNEDDRINWLTSQAAYSAAVAGGHGDVLGAEFRTVDNQTIPATYTEGLATLLAMAAWGAAVMSNSWNLKDQVAAVTSFAGLEVIDIEEGWPE